MLRLQLNKADTDGQYISEGKLSESTMKIQDSLYYQDFSYVLKVGQSINTMAGRI